MDDWDCSWRINTGEFPDSSSSSHSSHILLPANSVLAKSRWKSTNYIPAEPVLSQDHESIINFNNSLLHNANRRKRRMETKPKSRISPSIFNEITNHKWIRYLWATYYTIPNSIEAITWCEIQPFLDEQRRVRWTLALMMTNRRGKSLQEMRETILVAPALTIDQSSWTVMEIAGFLQQLESVANSLCSSSTELVQHLQNDNQPKIFAKVHKIFLNLSKNCDESFSWENEREEKESSVISVIMKNVFVPIVIRE